METNQLLAKVLSYLPGAADTYVHRQALTEIVQVFLNFLEQHQKQNPVSWVMNAKPGHGKTTAMTMILKYLADQPRSVKVPTLVALRYVDQLEELASTLNKHKPRCAVAISTENIAEQESHLSRVQFVLITHARLKNLALNPGQFSRFYKSWSPLNHRDEPEVFRERLLIVDEMPDMVDGVVFDLGTMNNGVDWFDKLAVDSGLPDEDRFLARSTIMLLLAKEFVQNKGPTNRALTTISDEAPALVETLGKLPKDSKDGEAKKRLDWFSRLLSEAGVARLYREKEGRRLLAAQKVDYTKFGVPLLIMDGTADVTRSFYSGYELQHVHDYNDYSRVHIHWRIVSTSKLSREGKSVQETVARDIRSLQEKGIKPFPITSKDDFGIYKSKGVITPEHEACFDYDSATPDLTFHLRNLAGSNRLNRQTDLYLTSLPIMSPDAYRLMAFAIFGPGVPLELSQPREEGWFSDPFVEMLYQEWLTAELLQLIHRSALRQVMGNEEISIYTAHRVKWVTERLQAELGLPSENVTEQRLFNPQLYGFEDKVRRFGKEAREYFDKVDTFNGEATVNKVAPWFNDLLGNNLHYEEKLAEADTILLEEFALEVRKNSRGWRVVRDRTTS